jgi:cyanate permease
MQALGTAPIMIVLQSVGPPFAGRVFDATGSYDSAFWSFVAMLVVAAGLLVLLRQPGAAPAAAPGS